MKKIFLLLLLSCSLLGFAQTVTEPANNPKEWSQATEPFRIAGNLYYVGTYDLASYLIVTEKGNILINTGLANSLSIIKENIKALGFDYKSIKILLLTQAHFDHLGAMAEIKKETGAKLYVDDKDADALETGGKSDYELGKYGVSFKPVKPDVLLKNDDKIKLGSTTLTMLHHPGHTKGSCSFIFDTKDKNSSYKILIANMPSIIVDRKFSEIASYKDIQKDYTETFKAMKKLDFDLWVASHASQFDLHNKRKSGDPYNPKVFMDKSEFFKNLQDLENDFLEKIKN
ncbi:PEDO-2 family subclass B3 metallo-beta-lactamase [Pedobacter alluvionis]|uniref:Metallo-beta-lactamase class B n=1 Tax=Pedobacter alluvionis TaxID=475253 RepID=A0A497XXI4_9SPHI|nr:PEDO-2 family subclass B3 metallo-beta-lactamase [Pedobacter alluvionis]RLJ74910.1 metallo-beta-lactamase class B [Pedobacter alluvionis]TFB30034.1 PEDO-2 family subclass B3 metallo-beta-lactamase [Pedobacter alluvionis]